jgi:hypothetical protein
MFTFAKAAALVSGTPGTTSNHSFVQRQTFTSTGPANLAGQTDVLEIPHR